MATLAEIRAKLQQQEKNSGGGNFDNTVYPLWNIPEGSTARSRFLPDGDPNNDFFWVERLMIKLPFSGVKGGESKNVVVQVPCMEMYGETCPVLTEVRPWFKDSSLEELGRKYWKKKSYIFQGFVRESPMAEENTPENPIRRYLISPQIFNVIKAALMDTEIEELPTDYERGLDFLITKTTKGNYSDYATSKWSRKESPLSSTELAAIEQYGLFNLGDFLPKKPTDVEVNVIKDMFEASVDGQPYDPEAWGQYFKPFGVDIPNAGKSNEAAKPAETAKPAEAASTSNDSDDDAPFDTDDTPTASSVEKPESDGASNRTQDVLDMIRRRQTATS